MRKGFQLACFIIPDRSIAIRVLRDALHRLQIQHSREQKRTYWRDKYLKRRMTRIVRNQEDTFQWLIYLGTEDHERQQEEADRQNTRDMVIRYVKYLVQTTTVMSSFYVAVGLHRLLHNYSTPETQKIYESLIDHYPGLEEYRRVKGMLLNQLQQRFASFLHIRKGERGEFKFDMFEPQDRWADLVDECLCLFTPWSTRDFSSPTASMHAARSALWFMEADETNLDYDSMEIRRCHVLIDPLCNSNVMKALKLVPRRERLALPIFFLNENGDKDDSGRTGNIIPELTEDEQGAILEELSQEAVRRQQVSPESLRIVAHGKEYARFNLSRTEQLQCWIPEGIKLIEIWTESHGIDILLAVHWVAYTHFAGIREATATVGLGDGKELLLEIRPQTGESGNRGGALRIRCQSSPLFANRKNLLVSLLSFPKLPRFALVAVVLSLVALILSTLHYRHDLGIQQAKLAVVNEQFAQERSARASLENHHETGRGAAYRLIPDDFLIRSAQGIKEPVVTVPSEPALVMLELPLEKNSTGICQALLKRFTDNREVLTEKLATLIDSNGAAVVKLALPSSLVQNRKHYVISLECMSPSGKLERVRTFTFFVVQE
jgi:hypothetical protein